jgi:hypothetical protein
MLRMDQTRSKTPFQNYLERLGDKVAAERLGVPARTVKSWRLGDRVPRTAQALHIIGAMPITMDDIYRPENAAA